MTQDTADRPAAASTRKPKMNLSEAQRRALADVAEANKRNEGGRYELSPEQWALDGLDAAGLLAWRRDSGFWLTPKGRAEVAAK